MLTRDREPNTLQRSEVVALFNTFHRISESINNIEVFRELYEERKGQEVIADPIDVPIDFKKVDYMSTLSGILMSLKGRLQSLQDYLRTAYERLLVEYAKATREL